MMRRERRSVLEKQLLAVSQDLDLEPVLIHLQSHGVLTDALVETIKKQRTLQSARAELVRMVKSRGDRAFDIFFLSLIHSQQSHLASPLRDYVSKEVIDSLENSQSSSYSLVNRRSLRATKRDEFGESQTSMEVCSSTPLQLPAGVLHDLHVDQIDGDSQNEWEFYTMNKNDIYFNFSTPKGLALIINNKRFASMPERTGTDVDRTNLENLFKQLGYVVQTRCDLTSKELLYSVQEFAADSRHAAASSAVLCILSHGEHDCILGVDDRQVPLPHVLQSLNAVNCPHLQQKPKLVFIQACRGERKDHGFMETDGGERIEEPDAPLFGLFGCVLPQVQVQTRSMRHPVESDFLISYATPPFHVSWRNSLRGSWFVQSLCEIMAKRAKDTHLTDIMTMVNEKVSGYETGGRFKQMPEFHSRLRKKFFFFPGMNRRSSTL